MRRQKRGDVVRPDGVHVLSGQCPTCIFRSGNLMHLEDGRATAMLAECQQRDTVIPCHETLDGVGAICRGLYNRRYQGPGIAILQVAERLGVVVFDGTPNGPVAASLQPAAERTS